MKYFYVRPLVLNNEPGGNAHWLDVPVRDAKMWGVNTNPEIIDQLVTVLPSRDEAEEAVEVLNRYCGMLLGGRS